LDPVTAAGRAALDALVARQAQIIAYIDDYKLLMIATLAVVPLLIVFKKSTDRGGGHAANEEFQQDIADLKARIKQSN
jgi:hypothetical protein